MVNEEGGEEERGPRCAHRVCSLATVGSPGVSESLLRISPPRRENQCPASLGLSFPKPPPSLRPRPLLRTSTQPPLHPRSVFIDAFTPAAPALKKPQADAYREK